MSNEEDDGRIALDSDTAVLFWTDRFGVTRDELEEAVEIVGDEADAVAAYLNIQK